MKSHLTNSSLVLLIGVLVGAYFFSQNIAFGSVIAGSEYNATHLTSDDVGSSTVKSIAGTLGSIVVSSSTNAGTISLYRVSSSTAPTATSSNTLMFTFAADAAEGTYTYDVGFGGGLLIDITPGFNGNYVMTWR